MKTPEDTTTETIIAVPLAALVIFCFIHWPKCTLVFICVGIPACIVIKAFWDMVWESKKYNREHDLP